VLAPSVANAVGLDEALCVVASELPGVLRFAPQTVVIEAAEY
jgi:hypothetical protein